MLPTLVNAATVLVGTVVGVLARGVIGERYERIVTAAIGLVALLIGLQMALSAQRIVFLALALVGGDDHAGIVGLGVALRLMRTNKR